MISITLFRLCIYTYIQSERHPHILHILTSSLTSSHHILLIGMLLCQQCQCSHILESCSGPISCNTECATLPCEIGPQRTFKPCIGSKRLPIDRLHKRLLYFKHDIRPIDRLAGLTEASASCRSLAHIHTLTMSTSAKHHASDHASSCMLCRRSIQRWMGCLISS